MTSNSKQNRKKKNTQRQKTSSLKEQVKNPGLYKSKLYKVITSQLGMHKMQFHSSFKF